MASLAFWDSTLSSLFFFSLKNMSNSTNQRFINASETIVHEANPYGKLQKLRTQKKYTAKPIQIVMCLGKNFLLPGKSGNTLCKLLLNPCRRFKYQRNFTVFKCLSFLWIWICCKALWLKLWVTIMFRNCNKNQLISFSHKLKSGLDWDLKEIDVTYQHIPWEVLSLEPTL